MLCGFPAFYAYVNRAGEKIEALELQKADIGIDLSKLKIAAGIRYTKQDIMAWLKQFCKGDIMDAEFRRRIIDVFVNSVYFYDDKIVVYYNIKNSKQITYIDMCESTKHSVASCFEDGGKFRILSSVAHQTLLNPKALFIFVNGAFGCIFFREE